MDAWPWKHFMRMLSLPIQEIFRIKYERHNVFVPDAGSDPFAISCLSTHPIGTSLHGRTTSLHLSLRSALQGEDRASLNQGAGLKKGVWIAYP